MIDPGSLIAFLAVLVRSGAGLLPATLGAIVTEKSGATNLGVEGVMLLGAMTGYAVASTTGNPVLAIVGASLAGGALCVTHALPVVLGRVSQERQFVLGLILVFLGDALSRLFGAPFANHQASGLDARFRVPLLADLPVVGEALFQQRGLIYWSYLLALLVFLVLFKTRLGLHLRAVGEDPAAADSMGVRVEVYRFGAIVVGGMLMGFAGGMFSLSIVQTWTEGLIGGRGWIALGLVTFANWHPLWAIGGTLLFGGFEAAQFRLPATFPGAQYIFGILPYLAPIVTLPLIGRRVNLRVSGAPAALGRPYFREERAP
jgi:general nucleoside transport system permease protein